MDRPVKPNPGPGGPDDPSGLTRRQWLLRLGEAAVLAGFGGLPPDQAGEAANAASDVSAEAPLASAVAESQNAASATALPPGLYDPSAGHLTHVLARDQRFATPPTGSETEYAEPGVRPFVPVFFSMEEFAVLRQLVRVMLNAPPADHSSAGAAKIEAANAETTDEIAEWIDLVVSQSAGVRAAAHGMSAQHRALAVAYHGERQVRQAETEDLQKTWRNGLTWLRQESERRTGGGFLTLSAVQQVSLIESASLPSAEPQPAAEGPERQWYRLLKRQVIEGYYTSQAGLKELDYQGNAFRGESPGCAARDEGGTP